MDVLPHQRQCDRATVEEVVELMQELDEASRDVLLGQTACIVTRLSRLESDAARSTDELTAAPSSASDGWEAPPSYYLQLEIPYLGRIKITKNGISKAELQDECQSSSVVGNNRPAETSADDNMEVSVDSVVLQPELQIDDFSNMQDIALDPIAGAGEWALQGIDGSFLLTF